MVKTSQPTTPKTKFSPFIVFGKFKFIPENDDEISFNVGDPIVVLETDSQFDDGWWKGRSVYGSSGLFPFTYITHDNINNVDEIVLEELMHETIDVLNLPPPQQPPSMSVSASLPSKFPSPPPSNPPSKHNSNISNPETNKSIEAPKFRASDVSAVSVKPKIVKTEVSLLKKMSVKKTKKIEPRSPELWSVAEVLDWLISSGHEVALDKFAEKEITGETLLNLTVGDLREMGLELNDRTDILHSIFTLKMNNMQTRFDSLNRNGLTPATALPLDKPIMRSELKSSLESLLLPKDSGFIDNPAPKKEEEPVDDELMQTMSYFAITDFYNESDEEDNESHSTATYTPKNTSAHIGDDSFATSEDSHSTIRPNVYSRIESDSSSTKKQSSSSLEIKTETSKAGSIRSSTNSFDSPGGGFISLSRSINSDGGYSRRAGVLGVSSPLSAGFSTLSRLSSGSGSPVRDDIDSGTWLSDKSRGGVKFAEERSEITEQPINVATDYDGWLYVKIDENKMWKKRWCILKNGSLYICKTAESSDALTAIKLSSDYEVLPDMAKSKKDKFPFMLKHKSHTYHFVSDSQLSMVQWINALVRACSNKGAARVPMPVIPIKSSHRTPPNPGLIQLTLKKPPPSVIAGLNPRPTLPPAKYYPSEKFPLSPRLENSFDSP
ncbi:polar growth protein, partial [Nowakowskiella sp. JEL0407]